MVILNYGPRVADGLKHHVAVEFNIATNTSYLYLDGVVVATPVVGVSFSPSCSSTSQFIGWDRGLNYFNGVIDEFRF